MLEPLFEAVHYIFWIFEWWDMLLLNTFMQDLTQQTFGDQSLLDCINVKVPNQKSLSKGELLQLITFYTQQYFLLIVLFWKKTTSSILEWPLWLSQHFRSCRTIHSYHFIIIDKELEVWYLKHEDIFCFLSVLSYREMKSELINIQLFELPFKPLF